MRACVLTRRHPHTPSTVLEAMKGAKPCCHTASARKTMSLEEKPLCRPP